MRISDWSSDVCSSDLQTVSDIRGVIDVSGGRVTIASLISVATWALPPVLRRFAERHPRVGVRILDESEQEIVQYVRRGEAEFAVDMLTVEPAQDLAVTRSEEHTSELQSLMRISYAVFCLKHKKRTTATQSASS